MKRKKILFLGGSASKPPGFTALLPSQAPRRGGKPPLPGLAPESALGLRPRRALSSAPVSTSLGGQPCFAQRVVVADREE